MDPRAKEKIVSVSKATDVMKGLRCTYLKDKDLIVVTGFGKGGSRVAKIFDIKNMGKPTIIEELDFCPCVIMPFYDEDLGILYFAGKREGLIRYYDTKERSFHQINKFQSNIPQRGMAQMEKLGLNPMNRHEMGRFYKLTENSITSVSVHCGIKSVMFQPELYPDTNGFEPSGSPNDFFNGEELKPLEKVSLAPGNRPVGRDIVVPTFVPPVRTPPKSTPYEYWTKTELINHIQDLEKNVAEKGKELDNEKERVLKLKETIRKLEGTVENLKENLKEKELQLKEKDDMN